MVICTWLVITFKLDLNHYHLHQPQPLSESQEKFCAQLVGIGIINLHIFQTNVTEQYTDSERIPTQNRKQQSNKVIH